MSSKISSNSTLCPTMYERDTNTKREKVKKPEKET